MAKIKVQERQVTIISHNENEYISQTDIAKYKNDDSAAVIGNWMRNRNTIEFLAQFQRLFSDINLHVMSLRFGDFRVGTTDFVFVTWIHSRCEEAATRFEAQDG